MSEGLFVEATLTIMKERHVHILYMFLLCCHINDTIKTKFMSNGIISKNVQYIFAKIPFFQYPLNFFRQTVCKKNNYSEELQVILILDNQNHLFLQMGPLENL